MTNSVNPNVFLFCPQPRCREGCERCRGVAQRRGPRFRGKHFAVSRDTCSPSGAQSRPLVGLGATQVNAPPVIVLQNKLESAWSSAELQAAAQSVQDAAGRLARFCRGAASEGAAPMELAARDFSYSLARIYAGREDRGEFQSRRAVSCPAVPRLRSSSGAEF